MRNILGLYVAFIFLGTNCLGQENVVPLSDLYAKSWSGESGLEANNITGIVQANTGYMWVTSYMGAQKFDGYKSIDYTKEFFPFLRSNGFRHVAKSPDSKVIYFATQSSGVIKQDSSGFYQVKAENDELPVSIRHIEPLAKKVYIGSSNKGVFVFQDNELINLNDTLTARSNVLFIKSLNDSVTYFGTEGEGLFKMLNDQIIQHFTIEDGLKSNIINSAELIGDTLLIGTRSGINMIYQDEILQLDFMTGESINAMIARNNQLWIGSDNGLGRYFLDTKKAEFISSIESIDVSRINQMIFDKEGSLWLCTGRNGLVQVRSTGIINYNEYDGITNDNINVVAQGHNNSTYFIGADDGRVYSLVKGKLHQIDVDGFDQFTGIRDVLETDNGALWIASYKGLIYKDKKKEIFYGLNEGLPALDIRRIIKDNDGFMWLATRSGGLAKMENGRVIKVYNKNNHFNTDFILAIEQCATGGIYVGTHSDGIYKIEGDSITHLNLTLDDSGIIVFNIHIDKEQNRIWIITTAGVFLLDEGVFNRVKFESKFTKLTMYDWLEDQSGNVWITSNQGVMRVDRENIKKYLKNRDYKIPAIILDEQDGMTSSECTGAVRSLMGLNNVLYVPTIAGVSAIQPQKIEDEVAIPQLYIESLVTSNGKIFKQSEAVIEPGVNRYKFEFTALSFYQSDKIRFKYKLNGFDIDFAEVNGDRAVEYTNLSPGQYTFELLVSNGLGKWSEESVVFDFVIKPAFYQAKWFYAIAVIVVFFLIYLIYRWRVAGITKMNKKLIKVNKELDSFVYSASHDLRSPIASVLGLIELSHMDPDNIDLYLDRMEESMKKLDEFIAEIIDFSSNERKSVNKDNIDFNKLASKVVKELSFLNVDGEVEIKINVEQPEGFISDARRIAIIFRNLISNALKYRKVSRNSSFIAIEISVVSGLATIKIEDNGIGISEEDKGKVFDMFYRASEISKGSGLGLYIVKETIEKLEGELHFESTLGEGTVFVMNIPSLD